MHRHRLNILVLLWLSLVLDARAATNYFRAQVAPVLEAKCVPCHRPENKKSGFDLTTREGMLKGGEDGVGLVPAKPADSPVYTRAIPLAGKKAEMPKKGEPFTREEAEALRVWIAEGAEWPAGVILEEKAKADKTFWSFRPLSPQDPPAAADAPAAWQQNPVDRFVWAKLSERQLKLGPPASPRVFIRRAAYDLTGLPPTPEEAAAFERESARDPESAVRQLVDRLLASPRYGEQWGRHWLDVIRFGESRGYERNEIINNLWPFRDYIIQSFNEDKPFAQLVREHLAGDVIGSGHPEVEVGSAFLVAGPYDDVGNQDAMAAAQIRADQMDEIIRATGEAFLGVTIGCARCHDHKFDPLLARDYYALYATFSGTRHGDREVASTEARTEREARLKPWQAARSERLAEREAVEIEITARVKAIEADAARAWTRPRASRYGTEETFTPLEAKFVRLIVEGTDLNDSKATRFKLDEFEVWTDESTPRNVALSANGGRASGEAAEAKDFAGAYSAALAIDGKFGERWDAKGRELLITLAKPEIIRRVLFSSDRTKALPEDSGLTPFVGDYRIEVSVDGDHWRQVASSEDRMPASPARQTARLRKAVITPADSAKLDRVAAELARVDAEIAKVPPLPVWWVGTHSAAPGPFPIFIGGNPQRKGDDAVPASLSVLDGNKSSYRLDPKQPESERRLALAKWIVAPDNPLTPRVLANRVWHYHFGQGIVDTPSDFGYMGSRPTHPELLDWLAGQLPANGWKLKPLHRLIMTSQAYRQSTAWNEASAREDGDSRLLWRFPPRRLSAEEIRDTILSLAGKLDLRMGGRGFKLYEYLQDNVATYVPLDQHGPETYRRAVYHHNARAARVDVMTDFDCPDPAFAEPRRSATTTPLQALTLMNHSFALDMARALATRLEQDAKNPPEQVQRAFSLAFVREASAGETIRGTKLIEEFGLRAFCRALLNASELINLY